MLIKKLIKLHFTFTLVFFISFHIAAQDVDCDLACKYKKLQDMQSDGTKDSSTSYQGQKKSFSVTNNKALIANRAEVQRWLDEITEWKLYYDGEPLVDGETQMQVGAVSGDLDGFSINDFELSLSTEDQIEKFEFSIEEISIRDKGANGLVNTRPESLNDFIEFTSEGYDFEQYYSLWNSDYDFKVLGIAFSEDFLNALYSDPDFAALESVGLFDSTSLVVRQETSYSNTFIEHFLDLNQEVQVQLEMEIPTLSREEHREIYSDIYKEIISEYSANYYFNNECENDYDAYIKEAEEELPYSVFVGDYFVCLILSDLDVAFDPEYAMDELLEVLELYDPMLLGIFNERFSLTYGFSWSKEAWDVASIASGGSIDAAIFAANTFLTTKMSKFELVALLDGLGIPYEYKGLFEDTLYDYYLDFYSEAKKFVNFPRGLSVTIELLEPISPEILYQIEDNPMLLFNILNKIRFEIKANPRFKNL